ncbi:nucleotidyltransferase domain-containing protein [Flexivirga lutea]
MSSPGEHSGGGRIETTSLPAEAARAIAPLPEGYAEILDHTVATLSADGRVEALWLSGSLGRGVADAGSDLDLVVTVADDSRDDFVTSAATTWAFLDPVISHEMPGLPGSFVLTTADGLRVDAVLEATSDIAETPYRHRVPVFDRRHDASPLPTVVDAQRGPDAQRMEAIALEFARQLAIFPDAVVARHDWLLGQEAVHNYRRVLYELYVESNQPLPPMGVKQWSAKLTAAQRDRLASLQVPAADERSVVAAMQQVQRVIRAEGRTIVEVAGATWPEDAVRAGLARWQARGVDAG